MKDFFKEYLKIIISIITTLLFSVAFFYILLNAFHASSINKKVAAHPDSIYYLGYKENLNQINENIKNYTYDNKKFALSMDMVEKIYINLKICSEYMSENTTILDNSKEIFSYYDVYKVNNNFIDNFNDKCWTSNISWLYIDRKNKTNFIKSVEQYDGTNKILVNNALYIKQELNDNSSYYYNTAISNAMIRNNLNSSYQMVIRNYYEFSKMILDISNYLVEGDK